MSNSYQVKVDGFEGPLDLLLHLINRYEIDIYDIPVSQITDQYMNFIHTMQELELDVASEYLVMAATLLAIKSQMLLPNQSLLDPDEEEVEDPREDLMKRLIEYRKFKGAADDLKEKELEANRIYTRPQMTPFEDENDKEITSAEASVFDMIQAMGALMKRDQGKKASGTKIKREEIPIQMRMEEILGHVRLSENGTKFTKLFDHMTRPHIVVTFMALLELMKSNEVFCVQDSHFSELILFPRKEQ